MQVTTRGSAYSKRGYKDVERLDSLLDIHMYVQDRGYFLTKDGRMAVVFALPGISGEALNNDMKMGVSDGLARVIDLFPEGSSGQYVRLSHRDVSDSVARFRGNLRDTPIAKMVGESIIGVQERGAAFGFFAHPHDSLAQYERLKVLRTKGDDGDGLEEVRLLGTNGVRSGAYGMKSDQFLIFAMPTELSEKGVVGNIVRWLRDLAGYGEIDRVIERIHGNIEDFFEVVEKIDNALHATGLPARMCDDREVATLLYRMLNPKRCLLAGAPYIPSAETIEDAMDIAGVAPPMSQGLVGSQVTPTREGWKVDGYHYLCTSVKQMPEQTFPARLQDAMDVTEGEGWLTVNFHVPGQAFFRNNLRLKTAMLDNQKSFSQIPILAPDATKLAKQEEDLNYVKNATNPEEQTFHKVVRASIHFIVADTNRKKALQRAKALETHLWNSGYREQLRGEAMVHYSLPFNNRPEAAELIRRDQPVLSTNLSDMLPLYTGFKGIPDGRMVMNSSSGEPVPFDLMTREATAPHALIAGGTGTGKSFLANGLISQFRATRKSKVWVIDKGGSFESHCQSVGGEYIKLVPEPMGNDVPVCLNPLWIDESAGPRKPYNSEYGFMLTTIVAMLKAGTADEKGITETVTKEETNCILGHLQGLFENRTRGVEQTLSDLAGRMTSEEHGTSLSKLLVERIRDYLKEGIHGALFDGTLDVDWSNDFICIETQAMDKSPALEVLMMSLFSQINTVVKNRKPRDLPAMLVIDEAWSALANAYCARTVSSAFREWRKYLAAIILLSQSLADFANLVTAENAADDGILANTRHFFLLGLNPQDVKMARELFGLSPEEQQMWESTKSSIPQFVEFFYVLRHKSNVNVAAKLRYCADPMTYWMSTSDGTDDGERNRRTQAVVADGQPDYRKARLKAILELKEEYPYGMQFNY